MKNNDDRSYERYKQYRRNKYRYEQEQIVFPIVVIIGLAIIISFWKYMLMAITLVCVLAIAAAFIYLCLKKQLKAEQPLILSQEDAKNGVRVRANIIYASKTVCVDTLTPPNAKNGQKFVVKNILVENKKGKKVKKNIHFKIQVL